MNCRLPLLSLVLGLVAATPLAAQQLRHGVADATLVVIARADGVQPLGNELFVHRFTTVETFKGQPVERFSILVRKRVADQPQPAPTAVRVMCLRPETETGLPERFAPWYRMTGHAGDNPQVDESRVSSGNLELVRILVASEAGESPPRTAHALAGLALRGEGGARTEAVEVLRERPVLRDELSAIDRDALMMRAVGETADVQLKIALASLCAEAGMEDVVPALALSIDQVDDPRFTRALGRITRTLHGEEATQILEPLIDRAAGTRKDRLLLVLGATQTESALQALLKLRERSGPSPAIDAALRQHGDKRALEAAETGR